MAFKPESIALGKYSRAMVAWVADASAEELRGVLLELARLHADAGEQQRFLELFMQAVMSGKPAAAPVRPASLEEAIVDFRGRLAEQVEREADWDLDDGYRDDDDGYDEEVFTLGQYDELEEEATELFDRIDEVIDRGEFATAKAAYEALFEAMELGNWYGQGVVLGVLNLDPRRAVARYIRAVYETTAAGDRPAAVYDRIVNQGRHLLNGELKLAEIRHAVQDEPSGFEAFLAAWIEYLRQQPKGYADRLSVEAAVMSGGTDALGRLAHEYGEGRPAIIVDWLDRLVAEGRAELAAREAREALKRLPTGLPIRAAVADALARAGDALGDLEAGREARWEAFLAKPELARLVELAAGLEDPVERQAAMARAANHLAGCLADGAGSGWSIPICKVNIGDEREEPVPIVGGNLVHAFLLAGAWQAAIDYATSGKSLAESVYEHGPGGAVMGAALAGAVAGAGELPVGVGAVFARTVRGDPFRFFAEPPELSLGLRQLYLEAWRSGVPEAAPGEEVVQWAREAASVRANGLIAARMRNSYDEAAELVAAVAEVLEHRGESAASWVEGFHGNYKRLLTLQRELTKLGRGRPGKGR